MYSQSAKEVVRSKRWSQPGNCISANRLLKEEELEANHSQCRDAHSQLAKSVNVQKVQPKAGVRDQCRQHVNNGKAVLLKNLKIWRNSGRATEWQTDRVTDWRTDRVTDTSDRQSGLENQCRDFHIRNENFSLCPDKDWGRSEHFDCTVSFETISEKVVLGSFNWSLISVNSGDTQYYILHLTKFYVLFYTFYIWHFIFCNILRTKVARFV